MKGQWIGPYSGSNSGFIVLNIDECRESFRGVGYLNETTNGLPRTATSIQTPDKSRKFKIQTNVLPINPTTSVVDSWENVKGHYPEGVIVPETAEVCGEWDEVSLSLSWKTSIGTEGSCKLFKSKAAEPSNIPSTQMTWSEFKNYVADLEGKRYLFRGQNRPWRLRTSFHRAGRSDLTRFLNEDIQALHKHLSARTKHVFNLDIPNENGAFFNLIQHHGYPTPLLDWTYSPYVAAFFAYRGISKSSSMNTGGGERVRVLVLDQERWKADYNQIRQLLVPGLHLSISEFLAIENERMIPQQAASTVTNIDDIETYITNHETDERRYLWAIDIPVDERSKVVHELGYMGITSGSLFPGLDGACEELKERNFEI